MRYAAFISYSHAADGTLAPRLQGALHHFAKPWYRLRALRVFRDQTSLTANPDLWVAIEAALEESQWFLYMASPQAAQSPWVRKEVAWWLEHRSSDRMLVLVTEGELSWDEREQDFNWSRTTCLPEELRKRFSGEPLYVDLRWAKTEDNLSIRHLQFRSNVLDIAAPLHGKAKDDLDGEDVRQNRRNKAWAWSAGTALAMLTVAAMASAIYAIGQRDEARRQRDVAVAGQLEAGARHAFETSDDGVVQAAYLTAASLRSTQTDEGLAIANRVVPLLPRKVEWRRVPTEDETAAEGVGQRVMAFSPDSAHIAVTDNRSGIVRLLDAGTGQEMDPIDTGCRASSKTALAFSPNGALLAVGCDRDVCVIDLRTSRNCRLLPHPDMVWAASFSPDSKLLATASYHSDEVLIHDVATWSVEAVKVSSGHFGRTTAFSPDGRWLVTTSNEGMTLWRAGDYRAPVAEQRTGSAVESIAFEPGGDALVTAGGRLMRWDIRSDEDSPPQLVPRAVSIEASSVLSVPGRDTCVVAGAASMVRLMCGEPFAEALRIFATSVATALSPDGQHLINQESDGTIAAWQLDGGGDLRRVNAGAAVTSLAAAKGESWLAVGREDGSLEVFETPSWNGREVLHLPGAIEGLELSNDGRWCVVATNALFAVLDSQTWKELARDDYPGELRAVRFAPDQRFLLAVGDQGVRGYRAPGWQKTFEIADDARVERVAFDDAGSRIAVVTGRSGGGHDSGIDLTRVTDLASGKVLGWKYGTGGSNITHESMLRLIEERHTSETGGDTALVAASEAWTLLPLDPPEEFASADRSWVAKISDNLLWLSRPGRNVPIGSWDQQRKITGVLFFPEADPQWLVSAGDDGFLRLWPLKGSDLRFEICTRLKATLAAQAWAKLSQSLPTTPTCESG